MKLNCRLKGSTFCEGKDIMRHIVSSGQTIQPYEVYLLRDHNCKQDVNCVQVRYRRDGQDYKLGNVNKENAPWIAECMDKGGQASIVSLKLYGEVDQGQNVGMFFWVNTVNRPLQ